MAEKYPAPSNLEGQLKRLVREKRLSQEDVKELLSLHHRELAERLAPAVGDAIEAFKRREKEKDEIIETLKKGLEKKISTQTLDRKTGLLAGWYFESIFPVLVQNLCRSDRRGKDRRSGSPCLMVGDVRNLKLYNDTPGFGHDVGDALMVAVGETIRQNLRSRSGPQRDWASRSNEQGDEVEILMFGARDPFAAGLAAGRIKDAFNVAQDWSRFDPRLNELPPDVDFGAAAIKGSSVRGILSGLKPEDRIDKVQLIISKWRKKADELMYNSKHGKLSTISFGWYEWDDETSEFVDITRQMSAIPRLSNLRR